MFSQSIYPLLNIIILFSFFRGAEFHSPIASSGKPEIISMHWKHPATNSAIDIQGIEVDVFQWCAASRSNKSVKVKLLSPVWEPIGLQNTNVKLPETVQISDAVDYRGTPIVYIKIIPWRLTGNIIEVLSNGEIVIETETVDFPITFKQSILINGITSSLPRNITNTQYLILTTQRDSAAAQLLANMHSDEVDLQYQLKTNVILMKKIEMDYPDLQLNYAIREFLLNLSTEYSDLMFVLFLGDETGIPPIYSTGYYDNEGFLHKYPSDDFYTTPDNTNIENGFPKFYSGRIPASSANEAMTMVKNIREYTLNSTPGIWKSKVVLVADDMYRGCSLTEGETSHTQNSDAIYDSLKSILPIFPFYGIHYNIKHTGSGCAYPDLTENLIHTINNGVGLINYIGHGDPETWSGENILSKSSDITLIHPSNNKLAIWVAGTCSFGKYYGANSMMESLLFKGEGAIAVIATTDDIGYTENSNYLNNFFGLKDPDGILHLLRNVNIVDDINSYRLGALVNKAKNGNYYKFHAFGDPAMLLPFPQIKKDLVKQYPDEIPLIQEQTIELYNGTNPASVIIKEFEKEFIYDYGSDILKYSMPGETFAQINFIGESTCFRIPIDAGSCENCVLIQVYQDNSNIGSIQSIPNISIISSDVMLQDNQGPIINISQGNRPLSDGSIIYPNEYIDITLMDSSGINLLETIGHGIRYKFDEDDLTLITGDNYIFENCSEGNFKIAVSPKIQKGDHRLYLEAWDGVNNKNSLDINLKILASPIDNKLLLSKVYPFPNPFSENTYFTMFLSEHTPATITITIYTLNGIRVRKLQQDSDEKFVTIYWDGRDEYGQEIANGAYFYHVKAKTNDKLFEDIYKLAKVK